MEGLTRTEHPVVNLPWQAAHDNFYAVVRDGLDADIEWLLADGSETTDTTTALRDLLDHAAEGLRAVGLGDETIDRYLEPLRWRLDTGTTPAGWKREQVRSRLDDGATFTAAIRGMQRQYIDTQADTLIDGDFRDW
jgi:hypothetical protein